ncbi:9141_t:CDS:2 [Gigaspora margarita]|uniref:9141_t:CDS:1 n=1 Tax=Gigaspora margarita TaxID=4874 RepID=A0ABM8VZ03_GIGMA|nr:9141_t:CDS:2 [Gigaspora margarita]
MKHKISTTSKKSNKKPKKEEKINPISLILNYIDNQKDIFNASLVCKEWKNIFDNHTFWQEKNEKFKFGYPELKAKKYKTHRSIFFKNKGKLCFCYQEFSTNSDLIPDIYFKLHILKEYCENRNEYKGFKFNPHYNSFISFVQKEIEKIIAIIKKYYYYRTDFFKVIICNLYNIINKKDLYIERFGGFVKDFKYPVLKYVDYEAIELEKEEGKLYDLLNPSYREFIKNYK